MCGIFGIYDHNQSVSDEIFFGLRALQHRGQESAGIAVSNSEVIDSKIGPGLVEMAMDSYVIKALRGRVGIGHVRYSTSKRIGAAHAQPIIFNQEFAFAHNGNLPSLRALKDFASKNNIDAGGQSDSELMAAAIYHYYSGGMPMEQAIEKCYPLFTGAFSAIAMTNQALYAFRDSCGIRPLAIGQLNGGYVFASESCAFQPIGAKFIREVEPGELIKVDASGLYSTQIESPQPKVDVFEIIYFARPDSLINGRSVMACRKNFGRILAREHPLDIDLVVGIPQTAGPVALEYAQTMNIPMEFAFVKDRFADRTFIQPDQRIRELGIKRKFTVVPDLVAGKRVGLVDDSIVRGTTSKQLVQMIRDAGAKEVHFLISSPPVLYPDFYGIDIKKQSELVAFGRTNEQVAELIGADSVNYLSLEGLIEAIGLPAEKLCTSVFTGEYPIPIYERDVEIQRPYTTKFQIA